MSWRPPVDTDARWSPCATKSLAATGTRTMVLNWITPHQKWGIHSAPIQRQPADADAERAAARWSGLSEDRRAHRRDRRQRLGRGVQRQRRRSPRARWSASG
jgi:hypothetical protein